MRQLILRNLRIFFRDKPNVFFSLLGVFIVIGLYVLFLGDTYVQDMQDIPNARFLMDSWITAGMLAVASMTTTMGAFGIMIEDRTRKILKDFSASPLSRKKLAAGYIISTFLIGMIMCLITLVLMEIYVISGGGTILPLLTIVKVFGVIILSVLTSSSMVFLITTFLKSQGAFAAASTIIGTLVGFLTGIYIPIGILPPFIQTVVKCFPLSHAASVLKQIIMEVPLNEAFDGAPAEVLSTFNEEMGVIFILGTHEVTIIESILVLVATITIFYILAILNLSRKRKD